jgi:peptide/nickel transport system permease protein
LSIAGAEAALAREYRQAARRERLRLLARSPSVLVGAAVVAFWVVCAIFGQWIAPHDPVFDNDFPLSQPPSAAHPFGTDTNGRDVLSRVIAGSQDVLMVAPAATLLGTLLGTGLGLVTGYFRGLVDDVVSRVIEAVLALPLVVIAVLIVTAVGSRSEWVVLVTIGIVFSPLIARTVRAAVLAEARLDYVVAAKLRGERAPYIMLVEILPNVLPLVIVELTVRLGYAIFAVATLTFLGYGIQPPSPDWAAQINEYWTFIDPYWWMTFFPALAIATLVVSVNLVADGVREIYER